MSIQEFHQAMSLDGIIGGGRKPDGVIEGKPAASLFNVTRPLAGLNVKQVKARLARADAFGWGYWY